jgi:hypothetical protein
MMTNKIALVALSALLAGAAGCGSDSTPKLDASPDAKKDSAVDTRPADAAPPPIIDGDAAAPDSAVKLDGTVDTPPDLTKLDTLPDAPKLDAAVDVVKLDTAPADVKLDMAVDVATADVAPADTAPADTAPAPDVTPDVTADTGPPPCTPGATCAPVLGLQIDRMGRAGVNTALTDPFWDDGTETEAQHKIRQDLYNQASNPATWGDVELTPGKKVSDAIKGSLAAYDSLDGTSDGLAAGDGCGNQLAFGATYKGTTFPDYTLLTKVLTDDRLYVNSSSGSCTTYLAVEANELGTTNGDCGGRTPTYNSIDITYSALVTGTAICPTSATCPVSNGVRVDADKGAGYSETTFPFLGAPAP